MRLGRLGGRTAWTTATVLALLGLATVCMPLLVPGLLRSDVHLVLLPVQGPAWSTGRGVGGELVLATAAWVGVSALNLLDLGQRDVSGLAVLAGAVEIEVERPLEGLTRWDSPETAWVSLTNPAAEGEPVTLRVEAGGRTWSREVELAAGARKRVPVMWRSSADATLIVEGSQTQHRPLEGKALGVYDVVVVVLGDDPLQLQVMPAPGPKSVPYRQPNPEGITARRVHVVQLHPADLPASWARPAET